jgi:hypothetical protein
VCGPACGILLEDFRNVVFYVVGQLRLLSRDSIVIGWLGFDGEFAPMWDAGCTRATGVKQLMELCTAESKALLQQARTNAAVLPDSKNLSDEQKVRVKYQLVQAVLPLIEHCGTCRNPPGVALHPTAPGDIRTALELNQERTTAESAALLRAEHVSSDFERTMASFRPGPDASDQAQLPFARHVDLLGAVHQAGIVPQGTVLPASAPMLAFHLQKAVVQSTITPALVTLQVAQMIFEARKAMLVAADPRVDFNEHAFVPEVHPVFNCCLLLHEDDNHKRKRWTAHTRNEPQRAKVRKVTVQTRTLTVVELKAELERRGLSIHGLKPVLAERLVEAGGSAVIALPAAAPAPREEPPDLLIDKKHILEATAGVPSLRPIESILSTSADDQIVVTTQEFLQNPELQRRLGELGHWREAIMLQILGRANQAWDAEGLSRQERSQRMYEERRCMMALMGGRLHVIDRMDEGHVGGFPRGLLMAMISNTDAYECFVRDHPQRALSMVDRFPGTDDCEFEFGTIVLACGFKPSANVALGFFRNKDNLLRLRQDPHLPFFVPGSTKSSYHHWKLRARRETRWSDRRLLALDGEGRDKYFLDISKRAAAAVYKRKSIRSFHTGGV